MLPEVRMARVLDAIVSHRAGRLSCVEAGELLGLSERHFRRLRDAYEDRGEEGLVDHRRGRVSSRRVPDAEAEWLAEMFRTRYFDFTGQALPRTGGGPADGGRPAVPAVLQLGEERVATAGSDDQGSPARGPPAQARAASAAGHDAVSGRLETRMAGPGPRSRSDRDDGRRDQRDHFDFPVRGGGHGLQLSRTVGDDPRAWSVLVVLHRPGQPLLRHAEGGREGRQDATDAGGAGVEATARRAYPLLQPAGARADGTALGHVAEAAASAAEDERDDDDGGGQSLVGGGLSRATQRPLRRGRRGGRDSLH